MPPRPLILLSAQNYGGASYPWEVRVNGLGTLSPEEQSDFIRMFPEFKISLERDYVLKTTGIGPVRVPPLDVIHRVIYHFDMHVRGCTSVSDESGLHYLWTLQY
ncbi:unnamed protein product [Allacma fusca]|uniref:Uncharacterized protein n=1 Tax=Allacma fusca TaxID=39272 RepID=A0A8J2KNB0_9HEXA|nr:unnamed protein product [Allacma fusca]